MSLEVLDVLNVSEGQQDRTRERESSENQKYEVEIRNRKKFKRCKDKNDLGQKMHQINVVDER